MAGPESRSLSALGTFRAPAPPPARPRGAPGAAERQVPAPPPAPLAFLAPWLEGAVDLVRGGLWGAEGAGDTAAAKTAELLASLPALPLASLKALGFYSRVDKALDLIPAKGAHPNKVASLLKSNASAEELAYRNVPQFLAGKGNATVTRADLAAHLAAHPAPVPVVKKLGGPNPNYPTALPEGWAIQPVTGHPWAQFTLVSPDGSGRLLHSVDPPELMEEALGILSGGKPKTTPTKYAQYTVPGGENYRETLVTLPDTTAARMDARRREIEAIGASATSEQKQEWADLMNALKPDTRDVEGISQFKARPEFRSGHFPDDPNIAVWTRANERTLPTGERGRFVEEVQSDWHQKGKQKGYARDTSAELHALAGEWETARRTMMASEGAESAAAQARMFEITDQMNALHDLAGGVPDAPFKDKWPDLGLSQQVLETAADPRAEWIGFTGGATQAARYDLSKQIDLVEYNPDTQRLAAYPKDSLQAAIEEQVAPDKVQDYIGKEAAERLLQSARRSPSPGDAPIHMLSGVDLQVGGEGMRHFYDAVLPKRLEKIVKPFGGTVERGTLETPLYDLDTQTKNLSGEAAMWFARLTPEMKARILKEGLPLMSLLPLGVLGNYGQTTEETPR